MTEKPSDAVTNPDDPLFQYPRVMQPHRFNGRVRDFTLHAPVIERLRAFFGEEPAAAQSMFYFKPPGARGQALHQDNFYLLVQPGTCIAAWTAIDDCDADNGAMMIVPKEQCHPCGLSRGGGFDAELYHAVRAGAQGPEGPALADEGG